MSHTYEIRKRASGDKFGGMNVIIIDGVDTEYLNDPSQHADNAMKNVLERNKGTSLSPEKLATEVGEECERISRHCLTRVIKRIQAGSLMPGGYVPLNFQSSLDGKKAPFLSVGGSFNPNLPPQAVANMNMTGEERENYAVEHFLNRGALSVKEVQKDGSVKHRPMTSEERSKRASERINVDHTAEWKKNRKALFDDRSAKVKKIQAELQKASSLEVRNKLQKQIDLLETELKGLKEATAASHGYQYAYGQIMQAGVNFVSADIRIVPVMTNTTVDTERDAKNTVSTFTTLDEFDGSGYSSGGISLASKAVNIDDANDRAEFDCDDVVVSSMGAGTRSIQGILAIKFVTNLNSSIPLFFIEFGSPKTPDGSNFTFQINTEGLIHAADG